MNSTTPKKNGKKSPVGQRVAALFSDGYYAPAVIQALKEPDSENRTFTVKFDDGEQSDCLSVDMIGSNFAKLSDVKLKQFQKVYTTYNGREISGYIQTCKGDKVILSVPSDKEEKLILERSLEEIRLLDRRRSQRLQNSQMDYRKMIEEGSPRKNRPVSASIEVPKANRIRKTSEEPTMTELMAAMVLSNLSCSPVFHNPPAQTVKDASPQSFGSSGVGSWSTDPQHLSPSRQPPANSSSGSGRGPSSVQVKTELCDEGAMIPRQPSSPEDPIESDAGTILMERTTPTRAGHAPLENEDISDEPQDLSVPRLHVERNAIKEEESSSPRADTPMEESSQRPKNTMPIPMTLPAAAAAIQHGIPFQYYFPSALIQQHYGASLPVQITSVPRSQPEVRSSGGGNGNSAPGYIDSKMHRHLHRAAPYHKHGAHSNGFNLCVSIKEESSVPSPAADNNPTTMHYGSSAPTTYYPFPGSPIPVSSLSFSPTHRVRQQQQARSPLTATPPAPPMSSSQQQHAKAAQSAPVVVPAFAILRDHPYQSQIAAQPINIPGSKAFSWHSAGVNYSPKSPVIHHHSQMRQGSPKLPFPMSPKSVPLGRKVRGDGKKCRKVYGMENRDLWCTACRWKKACQRFPD